MVMVAPNGTTVGLKMLDGAARASTIVAATLLARAGAAQRSRRRRSCRGSAARGARRRRRRRASSAPAPASEPAATARPGQVTTRRSVRRYGTPLRARELRLTPRPRPARRAARTNGGGSRYPGQLTTLARRACGIRTADTLAASWRSHRILDAEQRPVCAATRRRSPTGSRCRSAGRSAPCVRRSPASGASPRDRDTHLADGARRDPRDGSAAPTSTMRGDIAADAWHVHRRHPRDRAQSTRRGACSGPRRTAPPALRSAPARRRSRNELRRALRRRQDARPCSTSAGGRVAAAHPGDDRPAPTRRVAVMHEGRLRVCSAGSVPTACSNMLRVLRGQLGRSAGRDRRTARVGARRFCARPGHDEVPRAPPDRAGSRAPRGPAPRAAAATEVRPDAGRSEHAESAVRPEPQRSSRLTLMLRDHRRVRGRARRPRRLLDTDSLERDRAQGAPAATG